MAHFNQMMTQIYNMTVYAEGYDYYNMYNVMVYNIEYNIIPTDTFNLTYAQIGLLYDFLRPLVYTTINNNIPAVHMYIVNLVDEPAGPAML